MKSLILPTLAVTLLVALGGLTFLQASPTKACQCDPCNCPSCGCK